MNHWLLDTIVEKRRLALHAAERVQFYREMARNMEPVDQEDIEEVCAALEIAVLDLQVDRLSEDPERKALMSVAAADAFRLLRVMPIPDDTMEVGTYLLKASALAVLGDRGADAARWLRALENEQAWPALPLDSTDWGKRCRATITDVWLRLVRKKGWEDRDAVLERVAALRIAQQEFERDYLQGFEPLEAKRSALELIANYHLAKAADVLAHFITDGVVDGDHQVQLLLDSHFDRALSACETARLVNLEPTIRLLARAAAQMVENSIWTVTRGKKF